MQGDLIHTALSSYAYLQGHIADFYEYNKLYLGGNDYLPTLYIIFALWNTQLHLLGLSSYPTLEVFNGLHWSLIMQSTTALEIAWWKTLLALFYIGSVIVIHKIAELIESPHKTKSSLVSTLFDYVALSDQDDIWVEDKLSRAIDHIVNFGAASYSSDVLAFWANGKTKLIKKSQAQTQYDYLFESAGPGCTFVIRRHSINEFKKYITQFKNQADKILYHDWFSYAFMRSRNFLWVIDSYPGVRYRQHDKNEMGAHIGFNASFKRLRFISFYLPRSEDDNLHIRASHQCGRNGDPAI